MKKIYFTIFTLLSINSFAQYIANTNVSTDNYTKNLEHNGTISIGDKIVDTKYHPFQIGYNSPNKHIAIPISNGTGNLIIAMGGGPGWHSHIANAGDGVIRIMNGKNLIFGSGSSPDNTSIPGERGVQRFVFQDNTRNIGAMSVYNTGKVTIGTDMYDRSGYRLFVKDGIKTDLLKVEIASENQWADYVFNDDYNLMPINEVKNFITENNHLPNIPSAKDIVKEGGIEQGELNAKLLEKIEELTLYLIEQNQIIENLTKEVQVLKNK